VTVAQTLGAFGATLQHQTLPDDVLHHAKRALVDWHAALIPGSVCAPASLLETALAEDLDRGKAWLASGRAATSRSAALINGTAAHTVEVDDIYREAIYHPGAPTIAAAHAQVAAQGGSGLDLLRAIVAGYEISTRIGAAMGRAHYRYWHNTGTVGTFGAAAAAASALHLPATAFAHALCTATTMAAGLQQAFRMDSMSKPLHAGHAAQAGLLAAQSAAVGVTGSLDVIDGADGLGHAMGDGPDWQAALGTLGQVFHITQMTFKNHACCGHTFAPIDGALALQQHTGLSADQVQSLHVATYAPALAVAGNPHPQTAAEARFSLPYVIAHAWVHGSVRLAAFTPERMQDPQVRALMQRIHLSVDPQLDAAFPGQRSARLRVQTLQGQTHEWFQPTRKGDPDAPLSDQDLNEKFLELSAPIWGQDAARRFLQTLWCIEAAAHLEKP
jgi:2-methylcitrate dehydratase PrpD